MSVRMNFEHELETLRENMDAMGKGIQQAFADLLSAIALNDLEELDRIQKNDRKINEMERKIEAECLLLLTRQQPVLASDLRIVSSVMKAVGDMETRKILCDGVELFMARDKEQAKEFYKRDDKIDELFNQVKEELVACLKEGKKDTDACVDLLMVAKYLERIGDHAVNISEWEVFKETGSIKNERIL